MEILLTKKKSRRKYLLIIIFCAAIAGGAVFYYTSKITPINDASLKLIKKSTGDLRENDRIEFSTDKTEYVLGEKILLTIQNTETSLKYFESFCSSKRPNIMLEVYEDGEWQLVSPLSQFWYCKASPECWSLEQNEKLIIDRIAMTDMENFLMPSFRYRYQLDIYDPLEKESSGLPGIVLAAYSPCEGEWKNQSAQKTTIYSNEFYVKENPLLIKQVRGFVVKQACDGGGSFKALGFKANDEVIYWPLGPLSERLEEFTSGEKLAVYGYILGKVYTGFQGNTCWDRSDSIYITEIKENG